MLQTLGIALSDLRFIFGFPSRASGTGPTTPSIDSFSADDLHDDLTKAVSAPYVELHCHSGYSFLDGASHPEELVLQAKAFGYPALALTDHDGLYGSMEFARFARSEGLQPITGAEVTLDAASVPGLEEWAEAVGRRAQRGRKEDRGRGGGGMARERGTSGGSALAPATSSLFRGFTGPQRPGAGPGARRHPDAGLHVTLLAETPKGYANLCRLLTEAYMGAAERGEPRLPFPSLLARSEGLICLTGCRRSPLLAALDDAVNTAEGVARRLGSAFGPGSLFVELQDNLVRHDARRLQALGRLADRLDLPVVATGNVHYHRPERHRLQDTLVAIRTRSTLDASHVFRRPNACFHLRPPEEVARRFRERPEAVRNTLGIAERCRAFDLTEDLGYAFPDFEGSGAGEPAIRVLARVCRLRLEEKYPPAPAPEERRKRADAEDRLERELRLVDRHGLAGFFLVYRDILELAREVALRIRGDAPRARAGLPPGRGRGSSVSSIICYLIGLSHVDPVETDLFLGRFLNEALGSVPDIDLDFPREIREELILAVHEKYGAEHTGLVCTFPTYRFRSAVRELGKVLDLPAGDLEKLAKLGEGGSAAGLREELDRIPEFAGKADRPPWSHLAELAEAVAGLPRHLSQHVGGMIVSSRPLLELVPLEPAAMEGRVLCQWDKDSCEDAGFIKIDFLALGMLSLVEEAVDLIAEGGVAGRGDEPVVGVDVPPDPEGEPTTLSVPDLSRIDFDDAAVFDRICSGDTVGLFQVESRAQIQMLRRVRPRSLEELAIQVAIVRPGPIVGGAVNPYVRRREMKRADPDFEVPYDHPLLEDALAETLGVIIYQDQVLQVCRDLAGFTDGQAEGLRRAMSRKRSREAMRAYWEAFREGARERGVDEATARTVFRQVVAFSEFGFPKSHAAAFGLLAYQSAWLRHYYPVEYYAALFNNQPMGFYSLDALARDARRNGVEIRLPDVNRSGARCTVEESALRVGLAFVRGWSEETAEGVVAEREEGGPYRSLTDFLRRTPASLKRPAAENLIWVGGFQSLGLTRRELLWQVGLWLGPESAPERVGGRGDHPQLEIGLEDPHLHLPFPDLDPAERMVAEYRTLSFATSAHPFSLFARHLPPERVSAEELEEIEVGRTVTVAGIVTARQRPKTAKGYTFVLIEDESGPINSIVKPPIYEKHRATVRMEPFVAIRGRLQKDGASIHVIAFEVRPLRLGGTANERPSHPGGGRDGTLHGESLAPLVPGAHEGWAEGKREAPDPFEFLTALRQTPPGARSFG